MVKMNRPDRSWAGILGCASLFLFSQAQAQTYGAWSKQSKITMNTSATGANINADVAGFPVAINLTEANFAFAEAKEDGSDLRFSNQAGTALPYQIESWDLAAKKAAVWVRVDVKGNDATQYFNMHWGNAGADSESDGKKVFAKEDGWVSNWHLAEKGGGTGNYKDATENNMSGNGMNITGEATAPGRIGQAVNLDVAKKQYVKIQGAEKSPLYQLNTKATYSIWAKPKSHTISYQAIFTKGEKGFRIHYYGLASIPDNKGKHITEVCWDGSHWCPLVLAANDPGDQTTAWNGLDVENDKWYHMVAVLDKPKGSYWINGKHQVTWPDAKHGGAPGNLSSGEEGLSIGNNADRTRWFDGMLDEARILNVAKDSNWIKLDYESQREDAKFLTIGNGSTAIWTPARASLAGGLEGGAQRFDLQGRKLEMGQAKPGIYFEKVMGADGRHTLIKRTRLP